MATSSAAAGLNIPFCIVVQPAQSMLLEFEVITFSCEKTKKNPSFDLKETWAQLLPDSCRMKWEGGLTEEVLGARDRTTPYFGLLSAQESPAPLALSDPGKGAVLTARGT